MFNAIGKTEDKFIVNETHLANFSSQEKQSYLNCVSMLNRMNFLEIMLFATFLKAKDKVSPVYYWAKNKISALLHK